MSLLEIQVTDLEENMADLDQDVNFLFDEQVIQDERLFSLEQTTDSIYAELLNIDDELNTINSEIESKFKRRVIPADKLS